MTKRKLNESSRTIEKGESMYKVTDQFYGADADGNRGTPVSFYELGPSDYLEIVSQIIEFIEASGELPQTEFTVHLIDPVTEEDVSMDINPFDYMSSQQMLEYIKD